MPVSISHHEGIYFPHLQQSTRGAGETGQLGSRTVRRGSDRIHYAFRRSEPEIHERSAEQQAHERQKNSGPAPELNHSGNPHPLPELQQNNSKLTISAFPPLLPELRTGPVGRGELSTGSGITISAPWLTEETRRDLEKNMISQLLRFVQAVRRLNMFSVSGQEILVRYFYSVMVPVKIQWTLKNPSEWH
ncbi:hypothetical protein K1I29_002321 [Salmonella enterica subsp. enterica serovar Johannesburg]|nr:hypothetical protein [Salmonella enterica subsp. enterica serovar Johannesburg]